MEESKAQLTDRWRRENREEEVARFRRQVRDECRARGLSRKESNGHAWSEAAQKFPPLPPPKPPTAPVPEVRLIDGRTSAERVAEWNAEWAAAEVVEVGQPPADLPEVVDIDEDMDWTWRNFLMIASRVIERERMYWEIDWNRAVMPVPSTFAVEEIRRKMTQPDEFESEFRMRAPIRWWDAQGCQSFSFHWWGTLHSRRHDAPGDHGAGDYRAAHQGQGKRQNRHQASWRPGAWGQSPDHHAQVSIPTAPDRAGQ